MAKINTIIKEEMDGIAKDKAIERLKSKEVVYMELRESQFACEFCIFISEGFCKNKKIQAPVNPKKGCCNLYVPRKRDEKPSEDWQINEK